jgi:hypothetical protein
MLHIHTYKWGTLYNSDDVNRLYAMFRRNLTIPHQFHCSTDDDAGLRPEILVHRLPVHTFCDWDIGHGRKLEVFKRDFLGLQGELLIQTDIDMVLIGNVDFLAARPEEDFLIARGRNQANNTRGHSAIFRLRVGTRTDVWESVVSNPAEAVALAQHHRSPPGVISDQDYIDIKLKDVEFFDAGHIVYFGKDCNAFSKVENPRGTAVVPKGARIVSFAGRIKPEHVMHGSYSNCRHAPFVAEHWHEGDHPLRIGRTWAQRLRDWRW